MKLENLKAAECLAKEKRLVETLKNFIDGKASMFEVSLRKVECLEVDINPLKDHLHKALDARLAEIVKDIETL